MLIKLSQTLVMKSWKESDGKQGIGNLFCYRKEQSIWIWNKQDTSLFHSVSISIANRSLLLIDINSW